MPSTKRPPEPWDSFLKELDDAVDQQVRLDCIGGFVVTQFYGLVRPTTDLDVIELAPREPATLLTQLAGRGSEMARRYGLHLDRVGISVISENYEDRLVEMFPGAYRNLHLMAVDPYDLALSKLERNGRKDRFDVKFLATTVPLDLEILQQRYTTELRWQLSIPEREDLTLKLWIRAIQEGSSEI